VIPRRGLLALAGLAGCAALPARATAAAVAPRELRFPRDHGAHPDTQIEWWYATGWLHDAQAVNPSPAFGFQLTFFRSRTGLAEQLKSRFAARQLLFAHAAWNGDEAAVRAAAALADKRVHIGDWRLQREGAAYRAALGDEAAGFAYRLTLTPTQPLLLQGEAGFSRKGPEATHASHYLSEPHLAVTGELRHGGQARSVRGQAWLDHEWSDSLMPTGAVGWDWIGINLADGAALTAFQLRRADGSAVWAGGSHRARGGATRVFAADEVRFEALAHWTSAATQARYPVRWRVQTPAGAFELQALLEAQELDGRASLGTVYWEGLSELRELATDARLGLGYLEMTGYVKPLRL
jgi:predicted secreted hydrolase